MTDEIPLTILQYDDTVPTYCCRQATKYLSHMYPERVIDFIVCLFGKALFKPRNGKVMGAQNASPLTFVHNVFCRHPTKIQYAKIVTAKV